jgi:hypothetical protein
LFDHKNFLNTHPDQYDAWVNYLRYSAATIPVDLTHITERHGKSHSGPQSGDLFLLEDNEIATLIQDAVSQAPYTFADSNHVTVYLDTGRNIGLDDYGNFLTAVQVVIDTTGMHTASDWQNAKVSTAFPAQTQQFGAHA